MIHTPNPASILILRLVATADFDTATILNGLTLQCRRRHCHNGAAYRQTSNYGDAIKCIRFISSSWRTSETNWSALRGLFAQYNSVYTDARQPFKAPNGHKQISTRLWLTTSQVRERLGNALHFVSLLSFIRPSSGTTAFRFRSLPALPCVRHMREGVAIHMPYASSGCLRKHLAGVTARRPPRDRKLSIVKNP